MDLNEIIRILSDIRNEYNCFDDEDEEYYRGLSEAIRLLPEIEERTAESAQNVSESDLVSRKAAIDGLESLHLIDTYEKDGDIWTKVRCKDVADMLNALPAKMQWIPCSERLPEDEEVYLVTRSACGSLKIGWNVWCNGRIRGWVWAQGVTAWMPLPDPWKGEDDG